MSCVEAIVVDIRYPSCHAPAPDGGRARSSDRVRLRPRRDQLEHGLESLSPLVQIIPVRDDVAYPSPVIVLTARQRERWCGRQLVRIDQVRWARLSRRSRSNFRFRSDLRCLSIGQGAVVQRSTDELPSLMNFEMTQPQSFFNQVLRELVGQESVA